VTEYEIQLRAVLARMLPYEGIAWIGEMEGNSESEQWHSATFRPQPTCGDGWQIGGGNYWHMPQLAALILKDTPHGYWHTLPKKVRWDVEASK
jgi:hypothetical protein